MRTGVSGLRSDDHGKPLPYLNDDTKLNCVNKLFACVQTSPFKLARFRRPIGKKITLKTSAAISKIINPAFFYNVILKCSRISLLG